MATDTPLTVSRRSLLRAGTVAAGAAALSAVGPVQRPAAATVVDDLLDGCARRIDVHCHHIPDFYRAALAEAGVVTAGGIPIPPWSPELAVNFMNSYGIQAQVVSISEPGVTFVEDRDERVALAQQVNDWTAENLLDPTDPLTGGRFGAFAVLPLRAATPQEMLDAATEAERCINELGFDGVGIFSNYQGTYLGDPVFEPLFAALDALGAMVFLHPVIPSSYPDLGLPEFLYEFPFDTTRAAVNMSYKQVFTLHPNIRWLLAHAGGTLPYLAYRASLLQVTAAAGQNLGLEDFDDQNLDFGRLYYDTALSPAPSAMQSVREVTTTDHIMFATDWPFSAPIFVVPGDPAPQLRDTFDDAELLQVDRTNALREFPNLDARITQAACAADTIDVSPQTAGASGELAATGGGTAAAGAALTTAGTVVRRRWRRPAVTEAHAPSRTATR